MTDQILGYYHSVSEFLSIILNNVGYSREDRERKVRVATEREVFENMFAALCKQRLRMYMFGSRGEGSTGPGLESDKDILVQDESLKVVTDVTDCHPDKVNYLMVKDNFTHPGYVKLQELVILPDNTTVAIYHEESDDKVITLDLFNRTVLSNTINYQDSPVRCTKPSPAWNDPAEYKEYSTDIVYALRCSQWPREGLEWFQRRRLHGWPTPKQIANAWGYGCFVTAVGHPQSQEKHVEWRLSFSIAERDLTRSFEDAVMKVYILLKIIKKTFIEPVVGDAFSSYHCKVCMLWMRERTPRDLWRDENLLYCLILCIRQLYEWATAGFCPDYFIVSNNIYDRKIVGANQVPFVQILGDLLSTNCGFLLEIKCCYLGQLLTNRISRVGIRRISALFISEVSFDQKLCISVACACRYAIFKHIPQYYAALVNYIERLVYASKRLSYSMQCPLKHAMMFLCAQLGFHIASVCKEGARSLSREQIDYLVNLALSCLSIGINSDATSVRLKLCGLGMELGNYDLSEVCLQHISDYRMRYMYSATVDTNRCLTVLKYNMNSCLETLRTKRYSTTMDLLQSQVSFSVVCMPSEIAISPKQLRMEMFRSVGAPLQLRDEIIDSWYDWGVVDSLMCLHFFQYLTFSFQRKVGHKQVAMDNMIHVIRTEPDILHRDTALNLLGYAFMQENRMTNAFICFTQSLKIRPYHNAAKFYLGFLFKRVHVTHRRHVDCGSMPVRPILCNMRTRFTS